MSTRQKGLFIVAILLIIQQSNFLLAKNFNLYISNGVKGTFAGNFYSTKSAELSIMQTNKVKPITRVVAQAKVLNLSFINLLLGIGTELSSLSYNLKTNEGNQYHQLNYSYQNLLTEVGVELSLWSWQLQCLAMLSINFASPSTKTVFDYQDRQGNYQQKVVIKAPGELGLGVRINKTLFDLILLGVEVVVHSMQTTIDKRINRTTIGWSGSLLAGVSF